MVNYQSNHRVRFDDRTRIRKFFEHCQLQSNFSSNSLLFSGCKVGEELKARGGLSGWKPSAVQTAVQISPRLENLFFLETSAPRKPPHLQNLRCSQTPQGLGILKTRNHQTTFLPPSSHLRLCWFEFCHYPSTERCAASSYAG